MTFHRPVALLAALGLTTAIGALIAASVAWADSTDTQKTQDSTAVEQITITAAKTTRSSVVLGGPEIQKILPGVSPLKAIQTLPGVLFTTADPWGNNEQNELIIVHGFSTQQLGFTMDNVPLGDQQYGNYNGLSPSRALSSENVGRVVLSSGAGELGVASTSNLGGAIETFSRDPSANPGATVRETFGSYYATRTFARVDTGEFGNGNSAYGSFVHQDQRAWDFDGHQRGDQANLKYIHNDARGKLTIFGDWQSKVEPNEDATAFGPAQTATAQNYTPYTRAFTYPNLAACVANVNVPGQSIGTPPTSVGNNQGNNFSNCFSAAQRTDLLGYVKYDYKVSENVTWSNQAYYHYDYGRGIVAGPINQAGLPGLFGGYFPGDIVGGSATSAGSLANLATVFGGTGLEVRTTEYRINRQGAISTLNWQFGSHAIEAGLWYEHDASAQHRVWYPFSSANDDLSPYTVPDGAKAFTQYYGEAYTNDAQFHLQDQWRIIPSVLLQAGFKTSNQTSKGVVPIEQVNIPPGSPSGLAATNPPVVYPSGVITTNEWFLPQFGAVWDINHKDQAFVNIQNNARQFIDYIAGSSFNAFSPWSLGTQSAFNLFKHTVHPETSWTYELGARTHRPLELGPLTSVEGQASVYHVNFANRLLNVAPYNFINPPPSIDVNVGGVTTNGVDIAGTLNFGRHFHAYNALSYNKTTYDSNYISGAGAGGVANVVPTGGKTEPLTPDWLNKTILSVNAGRFEAQINGDFIGRRYVSYTDDFSIPHTYTVGLEASYFLRIPSGTYLQSAKLSANVTNLTDTRGVSTATGVGPSYYKTPFNTGGSGFSAYPIAPTQGFVTLDLSF